MSASTVLTRAAGAKSRTRFKAVAVAALVLLLTAIITGAGLRASLRVGRLSIPPTYDDVVYFISAAKWLSAWPGRTLAASLQALLAEHAPFSTVTAIAGFLLSPDGYVGHYAINAVVMAGFMFGIAALVWRSGFMDIAICITAAACFPVMVQLVNEARPDLPWGLASGLVIGAIVHTPIRSRSLPAVALLGFCCGLAALVKPSALPASLVCFAAVFLIATVGGWFDSGNVPGVRNAAWRGLVFGVGVIAALAPYLGVSFSQITGYIWRTLVENRALWALDAGLYDHAVYYSFGPVGQLALGGGLLVGLGLFAVRLVLAACLKSRDLVQAVVLGSAIAVTYAIPSVSVVKSYFLGAIFYGAFVVATALNFAAVVALMRDATGDRSIGRIGILSACRAVVLVALAGVFLGVMVLKEAPLATVFDEATRQEVRASSETMWPILRGFAVDARRTLGRPLVAAFSSPFPVNPSLMQLYAEQAHIPLDVRGEFFQPRLDDALRSLTSADLAVVPSSLQHNLPGPRMGDDLIRALDGRSDFCVVQSISLPNDRVLRLYRKADQGCSLPSAR